jgi:hypothetical protein
MTKTQVEVITSVQRRRRWSQAEKERSVGAGSDDPGCGARVRGSCEPGVSLAPAAVQPGCCSGGQASPR